VRAHSPFRRWAKFPVFPVETGNFVDFSSDNPSFGRENGEPNQLFASQFP